MELCFLLRSVLGILRILFINIRQILLNKFINTSIFFYIRSLQNETKLTTCYEQEYLVQGQIHPLQPVNFWNTAFNQMACQKPDNPGVFYTNYLNCSFDTQSKWVKLGTVPTNFCQLFPHCFPAMAVWEGI